MTYEHQRENACPKKLIIAMPLRRAGSVRQNSASQSLCARKIADISFVSAIFDADREHPRELRSDRCSNSRRALSFRPFQKIAGWSILRVSTQKRFQ